MAKSSKAAVPDGLIPAASYIRMSSSKQEASPDQQRAEVAKLAAKHGCYIVTEFFDDAISGDDTPHRKGFQAMHQAACNGGGFKVIFCWSIDRFGRFNSLESGYWVWPLVQAGVRLITFAEGPVNWNDFTGRIMSAFTSEAKHQFLVDLSRNVVRGQLAGAAQGLWQGGPAPYGYKLIKQHLVPDSKTAPVYRRIIKELVEGQSTREVADGLNRDGVLGPKGGKWRFSRITKMVKKRVYLGEFRYGDEPEGRYHWASAGGVQEGANTRKGRHWRKEHQPVVIPKAHKALVSVKDFDRVQAILKDRTRIKSPYRPKGNPYLVAGLLKCAHCSNGMVGMKTTITAKPEYEHRLYICAGYQQGGTSVCNRHYVTESVISDVLVRKLEDELLNPSKLAELRKELRRQLRPVKSAEDPQRLRKQIEALDRRIDQGAEKMLAAPPSLTATLTAKLDQWHQQRAALEARLKALVTPEAASAAESDKMVDEAIGELAGLREGLHQEDRLVLRDVLQQLVGKVELWFKWRPERKRQRAALVRGLIHLRPELQSIKLVSSVSTDGKSNSMPNIFVSESG